MRVGHVPLMLVFALAACGGAEPSGMSIALSRSELADGVVKARIQVHVKDRSCDDVRNSGPDKRATYSVDVVVGGGSGSGELHQIRPGMYTVAVWTFDGAMVAREFGCDPNVEIKNGKMAEVMIAVNPI